MKNLTLNLIALFVIGSFSWAPSAYAQEEVKGMRQKIEIFIDEQGDAELNLIMKLNASQWDVYKNTIGNNPSYLKREIIKNMPTTYLTDFKYEEDPMERSYKLGMKGLAAAQLNSQGKWESSLDMKDPEIIKLNDREFRLDLDMMNNGVFIKQTQMIHLPKNAKNAKIETDSFGIAVLTYETKNAGGNKVMMGLGILLILGGGFMGAKNLMSKEA